MKLRVLLAGALLVTAASPSFAAGPYVGAAGGVSIFHEANVEVSGFGNAEISYDTGYGINLAAGYNFDGIRLEGEFGYKKADVDKISAGGFSASASGTDQTMTSYMVNGYYDIKNSSTLTPFIGAGLGMIKGELEDDFSSIDDTRFGYNLMAGVSVAASRNLSLDLSYRLQGTTSDFDLDGGKVEYMSSNFYVGMRYNF